MAKTKKQQHHDGHDDRFEIIDFTIASEWETLVSKLENIVKKCLKSRQSISDVTINFRHQSYQFIYVTPLASTHPVTAATSAGSGSSTPSTVQPNNFMNPKNDFAMFPTTDPANARRHEQENFSDWFGVQEYFLILALRDTGPELSELSTIMSAVTVALHNENCHIPTFVGFDEKRLENFLGYMYMPIKRNSDHCFEMKLATESISIPSLNAHQNIAESIEKQLRILYAKLSHDPDDRNWDNFLSLTTISSKYTYIKNDFGESVWRYTDTKPTSPHPQQHQQQQYTQHQQQQQQQQQPPQEVDEDETMSTSVMESTELFRWGYPMDPIEQLHFCVMYPPLKSAHILDGDFDAIQTKSWFIKSIYRKPHSSLFQMTLGIVNVFNALLDSNKTQSIYQSLSDYNIKNRYTLSYQQKNEQMQQQQQHQNQTNSPDMRKGNQSDNPSLIKTVGSFKKSLASSLAAPLIPSDHEIDFVLRDLFFDKKDSNDPTHFNNIHEDILNSQPHPTKSTVIKRAPVDSLFFSFSFVCLNVQSLIGILVFWSEFVEEIKWHWEHSLPIPRTLGSDKINMNNCLIFQKMQMINYCISRKVKERRSRTSSKTQDDLTKGAQVKTQSDGWNDDELEGLDDMPVDTDSPPSGGGDTSPEILKGQYLLYHDREIVIPETQEFGPMTDDQIMEQLEEMMKLGDSEEANEMRLKKQTPSLLSDMESFKYANKGCVFEDFIRWHSRRDWVLHKEDGSIQTPEQPSPAMDASLDVDEFGIIEGGEIEDDESQGRTRGKGFGRDGHLSSRMTRKNIWRKTWREAKAQSIDEQEPLFDHVKQAENAIQYLRNINPNDLLYQMMSVILTSIAPLFLNEKSSGSSVPNELCLGMISKQTKKSVDDYYDTLIKIWPNHQGAFSEMKRTDFDPLFKAIQEVENSTSKYTSLKSKFKNLDRIIGNLYERGYSDIKENEFALVSELIFGEYDDASTVKPNVKEYITRSYAPRPFRSSQMMPHRMYTCVSQFECRVATVISEEDQ
ncbi:hypothetical protein SAMD00019534_041490 [Acytostelium subglobosum LB1]|uniref:hypothetical protein n=1 Tax=Acytostelium subglobosum LB1 TaxID=1410327 RepID=UPI000644D97E|nr:hypothetical protein SAMD00019534_041490 [Acytostelium subglobosum LB1]GAM20974.1 hypothetical protein SAMD00019534_041490 [Acytostelium subglobosum LB1]|eukprot:XP_012756108.1 hypothetical protein SAMD00019534_041490 [Acytostelium subglobosum LB1]